MFWTNIYFKNSFSAQSDWVKNGITLAPAESGLPVSLFHNHYEVVFVDTTGFYNICADMTQEVFYKVNLKIYIYFNITSHLRKKLIALKCLCLNYIKVTGILIV